MYYATFKDIGDSDILVFKTEKERDDWVNFKDRFSELYGISPQNAIFQRMSLDSGIAEERIKDKIVPMLHTYDEVTGQEIYRYDWC